MQRWRAGDFAGWRSAAPNRPTHSRTVGSTPQSANKNTPLQTTGAAYFCWPCGTKFEFSLNQNSIAWAVQPGRPKKHHEQQPLRQRSALSQPLHQPVLPRRPSIAHLFSLVAGRLSSPGPSEPAGEKSLKCLRRLRGCVTGAKQMDTAARPR